MQAESAKQSNNVSPIMRIALESIYLDWLNNYASIDTYAEHNQLTYKQAFDLITVAKDVYNTVAPDA